MNIRRILTLCAALCLLLLTGCGKNAGDPNVYNVEYGGKTYTVDQNEQTISVDGYTCRFEITGSGSATDVTITYPDGSSWWHHWSGNSGHGGMSADYDESRYISGYTLWNVLEQGAPRTQRGSTHAVLGFLLILFGVFEAGWPKVSWYLSHGWRYKNAEPSELALGLGRAAGILMIVIGIICFFV